MGYPFKNKSDRDRVRQKSADKMKAEGNWQKPVTKKANNRKQLTNSKGETTI